MADRFDLDAIAADDALLDLLAAGGESAWEAGEHDPALQLLADLRLAVEVEDELPVETIDDPEGFLARCAALNPAPDPLARKIAARGLALSVAAVAALSVSGVAAAVTGNPLSPYEKVIEKVVEGLSPAAPQKDQQSGLPAIDKSRIVKVDKGAYLEKQQKRAQPETGLKDDLTLPAADLAGVDPRPPLARPTLPATQVEKQITIQKPVAPPADPSVDKPADPTPPPAAPTGQPTDPTATPPPAQPTGDPTPTPTDPTPAPTDPPSNQPVEAGSGSGQQPSGGPAATPQANPPGDGTQTGATLAGGTQTSGTQTSGGDLTGGTQPGDGTRTSGAQTSGGDQTSGQTVDAGDDQTGAPSGDSKEPSGDQPSVSVMAAPADGPTRTDESFDNTAFKAIAKHSNDSHSFGYANAKYATGKHSSGLYAEGRHAALSRAHGSMAPVTLRQILSVLNGPMGNQ